MASNITPKKIRGILIPNSLTKKQIWEEQANFTQQNPRSGIPLAQTQGTSMVLSCAGTQTQDITFTTLEGGIPGEYATFMWKGENGINLGRNHDNILNDFKYWLFASVPAAYQDFDIVATSSGTLFSVSELINGSVYTISCHKQEQDGSITLMNTFFTGALASAPNETAKPSIVQLKDGSLLVTYFDYTSTDWVNLVVQRSFDNGVTWTKINSRGLGSFDIEVSASGYAITSTSMVTVDDMVVYAVCLSGLVSGSNEVVQFVSRDNGSTFQRIGWSPSTVSKKIYECTAVALPGNQVGFAYLNAVQKLVFIKIPEPGLNFTVDSYRTAREVIVSNGVHTFATLAGSNLTQGNVTTYYNEGNVYILAKTTTQEIIGWMSSDLGATWTYIAGHLTPSSVEGTVFDCNSNVNMVSMKPATWEGFSVVALGTFQSIALLYFGGWNSFTYPKLEQQPKRYNYLGWILTWIANQVPSTSTSITTTGTGTQTVTSTGLVLATSSTTRYYTVGAPYDVAQIFRFKMKVTTGNSVIGNYIGFLVNRDSGSNAYTLNIRFAQSQFVIRDNTGVLATINTNMTNLTEFVVFMNKQTVNVYYRTWDQLQAKIWTKVTVTLTIQATGLGNLTQWGHIQVFGGALNSTWTEFMMSDGGLGTPDTVLRGGLYPNFGTYTYIDKGLLLTAKEAPARGGESYFTEPRYDFPVENMLYQVAQSPRLKWKSTTTAQQFIPFYLDKENTTERQLEFSDVGGIHLNGINFKSFTIQYWDTSWKDLVTIDTSTGLQGTFQRVGATLQANSTATPFFLEYNECHDWYAELVQGENKYIVKLSTNSEGMWTTNTTYKRSIIRIDTDSFDVTTLPTSGTINIFPNKVTVTTELFQTVNIGKRAIAIKIPSQDTLEGWFQIGTFLWGSIAFVAPQYQRGRTISYEPNMQSTESMDNMFHSRKMSDGRRTISVAWTEPVDTRDIYSLDPDYWIYSTSGSTQPVAAYGDGPMMMMGIWTHLGNEIPCVYIPSIIGNDRFNDTQLFNRYHEHTYVRTQGAISMESVLGEELENELFRIATINLVEII